MTKLTTLSCFLFSRVVRTIQKSPPGMKTFLFSLFCLCVLLASQRSAAAQNVSWGILLPFPSSFYNLVSRNCARPCGNGYSKEMGYSKETAYCKPKCCGVPWWLQYRIEEDGCCCDTRLRQTT